MRGVLVWCGVGDEKCALGCTAALCVSDSAACCVVLCYGLGDAQYRWIVHWPVCDALRSKRRRVWLECAAGLAYHR